MSSRLGTRFTFAHTGFTGVGGFFLAKLLGSVRKKMLTVGLPAVLDDLDETGAPHRRPAGQPPDAGDVQSRPTM